MAGSGFFMTGKYEIHIQTADALQLTGWETSQMRSLKKGTTYYLTSYAPTKEVAKEKLSAAVGQIETNMLVRVKIEQVVYDVRFE